MQRILQGWYGRQIQRLHGEAEAIREGALQDVFALRRQLELIQTLPQSTTLEDDQSKAQSFSPEIADRLYLHLKELSDRLSPWFLDDNLLLAIRTRLDTWQQRYPDIPISLALHSAWPTTPYERNHLLLTTLDDLLSVAFTELSATAVTVELSADPPSQALVVTIAVPESDTGKSTVKLQDLGQVFQFLMQGKYTLNWYPAQYLWRGCWSCESSS